MEILLEIQLRELDLMALRGRKTELKQRRRSGLALAPQVPSVNASSDARACLNVDTWWFS